MEVLVAVISHEEQIDEILNGLLALGITGATVIESRGMSRFVGREAMPEFARLQTLAAGSRAHNHTLFSVIADPKLTKAALNLLNRVCGNFEQPNTGIVFTVPVSVALGLEQTGSPES